MRETQRNSRKETGKNITRKMLLMQIALKVIKLLKIFPFHSALLVEKPVLETGTVLITNQRNSTISIQSHFSNRQKCKSEFTTIFVNIVAKCRHVDH